MLSVRRGLALRRWSYNIPRNGVAAAVHPRSRGGGAMACDALAVHVALRPVSAIGANHASASTLLATQPSVRNGPAILGIPPTGLRGSDGCLRPIRLMSSRGRGGDVPRMKDFDSLAEMTHAIQDMISAGEHLATRDIAAYWTEVPKFVNRRNLRLDAETSNQMEAILCHTLEVIQTNIDSFHPRDLAQTAIALAKIMKSIEDREDHRGRLQKGSPHQLLHSVFIGVQSQNKQFIMKELALAAMPMRGEFDARHLANTIYAFGLAKYALQFDDGRTTFDVLAASFQHAVGVCQCEGVKCSTLQSNGRYATAKEPHPELFEKVANHIVAMDIRSFNSQDCSNTVWAYATAKESHPKLFQKVAAAAIKGRSEFTTPQHIANLLWAFASNGQIDRQLFEAFSPSAAALVGEFNEQELANLAWAYAVADVDAPSLFNDAFTNACIEKEGEFLTEHLRQLHQWNLWHEELKSNIRLPPTLAERCRDAFISEEPRPSALQDDVVSVLSSIGLQPQDEFLTKQGYRLDALVEVDGSKIGVEVDGPSHFVGRNPTGSTLLKHRQVAALDEIPVVSVPYWDWQKLGKTGKNRGKKQQYLRSVLRLKSK